jgi:hypothetical protein
MNEGLAQVEELWNDVTNLMSGLFSGSVKAADKK